MASRPVLITASASDPFVTELVQILQADGIDVLITHDAESTMRMVRVRHPALAVLDVALPDGDGFSLCRKLKSDPEIRETPVLFFSVLMARDRCMEAGADGFMLKPVEQEKLLEQIRKTLSNRVTRLPSRPRRKTRES